MEKGKSFLIQSALGVSYPPRRCIGEHFHPARSSLLPPDSRNPQRTGQRDVGGETSPRLPVCFSGDPRAAPPPGWLAPEIPWPLVSACANRRASYKPCVPPFLIFRSKINRKGVGRPRGPLPLLHSREKGAGGKKRETRSEKRETRSEKRETRSEKRETRSEKRETRSEKRETRSVSPTCDHRRVVDSPFTLECSFPIQIRPSSTA